MAVVEIRNRGRLFWQCHECDFTAGVYDEGVDTLTDEPILLECAEHELLTGHTVRTTGVPVIRFEVAPPMELVREVLDLGQTLSRLRALESEPDP